MSIRCRGIVVVRSSSDISVGTDLAHLGAPGIVTKTRRDLDRLCVWTVIGEVRSVSTPCFG